MIYYLSENKADAIGIIEPLLQAGLPLAFAKPDAGEAIYEWQEVGGGVLDGRGALREAEKLCERLHRRDPALPIAVLMDENGICHAPEVEILRVRDAHEAQAAIREFCMRSCDCAPVLRTYALEIGEEVLYMGYTLKLSPRERAVLRLLLYRAPDPVTTNEILEVCFAAGTQRAASLVTTVARINRLASEISQVPLIKSVYGVGYRLRDGIVLQS